MEQLNKAVQCFQKSCPKDCNLIAAALGTMYVELRRTSLKEHLLTDVLRSAYVNGAPKGNDQSLGPAQMFPAHADTVIRNNPSAFPELKDVASGSRDYRVIVDKLLWNSPCRLVFYSLKDFASQWDFARENDPAIMDISNRPEILATLYNIGHAKSIPKAEPHSGGTVTDIDGIIGNFGDQARQFTLSPEGRELLSRVGCSAWKPAPIP